jgi:hypothetical protein
VAQIVCYLFSKYLPKVINSPFSPNLVTQSGAFPISVARCYIFKAKICTSKFWQVLQCKILVFYMAIWSILRPNVHFAASWNIFPVLVCCTEKNLATLFPIIFFVSNTFQIQPFHKELAKQAYVAFCFMPGA